MTKAKGTVADRVLERHGVEEVSLDTAAARLGIAPAGARELLASGELKSPRLDPLGDPVVDYGSLIKYIVKLRARRRQ